MPEAQLEASPDSPFSLRGDRRIMPTTINKQRLFNLVFATESKTRPAEEEPRPVLEQFLYALCREG